MTEQNIEPNEGRELAHRAAKAWLDENELVPLVLIALEVDEPVEMVADRLGDAVQLDDVGMRTVPAAAREFLAGRLEQAARIEDQARRLQEMAEPAIVAVGVPALEDGTPFESLVAAADYVTPQRESPVDRSRTSWRKNWRRGGGPWPLLKRRRLRRRTGDGHLGSAKGTAAATRHRAQGPAGAERGW